MSRTYRAPPPRRRLRAGYVARLCWRCRYPVAVCDCPARALVIAAIPDPLPDPSDEPACSCDGCLEADEIAVSDYLARKLGLPPPAREWWMCHDNTPPLTQPLAALLAA